MRQFFGILSGLFEFLDKNYYPIILKNHKPLQGELPLRKYLFLLCLIGFLNPAYGEIKVINNNPDVPWINEIAKEIKENPENQWAKLAEQSLSNPKKRLDNQEFEKCLEESLFSGKTKYCILSIVKVSPGVASPIGPSGFTDRLSLARVRRKYKDRGRGRGRSYTFRELIEKVNWSYVCVGSSPFVIRYLIGLLNPATTLPTAIVVAGTGLVCVIVGEIGEKDKMNKIIRDGIDDTLKKKEEEDKKQDEKIQKMREENQKMREENQKTREESQKTREESQKTREESQKTREELQRLKESLDRLENPPTE